MFTYVDKYGQARESEEAMKKLLRFYELLDYCYQGMFGSALAETNPTTHIMPILQGRK